MIPLPDLLRLDPRSSGADADLLAEILEMAFLGGDPGTRIDDAMEATEPRSSTWHEEFFSQDLFIDELIDGCLAIEIGGKRYPLHRNFLGRVLSSPPVDADGIRFRQEILREIETNATIAASTRQLYLHLFSLLSLFKAPGSGTRLNFVSFRLEILQQAKETIDFMVTAFEPSRTGLRRLHEVGQQIQASKEYERLAALLDYEALAANIDLKIQVGPDGRIRKLHILEIGENEQNCHYRPPFQRWLDRLRLVWMGYKLDRREIVNRVIIAVYLEVAPALRSLLHVMGHLEFYLSAFGFADLARRRGLDVSQARFSAHESMKLDGLFNPLLLRNGGRPKPCSIKTDDEAPIVIVTGPNSGGKTRMLQAVGLAQVLGQAGLFVPASKARLTIRNGLFATLVERTTADQQEGRLGVELLRIRQLFEALQQDSLILLDELCSGTNPSEALEIFRMVLDNLGVLRPIAFITTHFLDHIKTLESSAPELRLEFLRVDLNGTTEHTYQFVRGVADTSLALHAAKRLGVTGRELRRLLEDRTNGKGSGHDSASDNGHRAEPVEASVSDPGIVSSASTSSSSTSPAGGPAAQQQS